MWGKTSFLCTVTSHGLIVPGPDDDGGDRWLWNGGGIIKKNSMAFSPLANNTDWATTRNKDNQSKTRHSWKSAPLSLYSQQIANWMPGIEPDNHAPTWLYLDTVWKWVVSFILQCVAPVSIWLKVRLALQLVLLWSWGLKSLSPPKTKFQQSNINYQLFQPIFKILSIIKTDIKR
jgi:hypothetical protein